MNDEKQKIRVVRLSLIVSVILLGIKFTAYFSTHSNAILTDALESIVNVAAGAFALYSIWYASHPRDENHPYGHGKIEFFSAGFEGGLIFIAGIAIVINAVYAFFEPPILHSLDVGTILTAIAGGVNFFVGTYLKKSGEKNHSLLMVASGRHLISDTISSVGLVIGLIVVWLTDMFWLDSVMAIIFGVIILKTGYSLLKKSVTGLLDETDLQKVEFIIGELEKSRRDKWIDIHNLRVIKYGSRLHVDCHITLPWYDTLEAAHDEVNAVEECVRQNSGREIEFFIHADPCVMPSSCRVCLIKDCTHRKAEFQRKIEWNTENLLPDKKHGL